MTPKGPTLREIFPGNLGRLALSTVVLRLQKPELLQMSMDTPISHELAAALRGELERIKEER